MVYITATDPKHARLIGKKLVEERLVACVNIFDQVNSIYWWEGRIHDGHESVIVAKTRATLTAKVVARVKELHSYEVPCIVTVPINGGNGDFLKWIGEHSGVVKKMKGNVK